MAEGYDDNEMETFGERSPDYDNLEDGALDAERNRLLEFREGDSGYEIARVKLAVIDRILRAHGENSTGVVETSFSGYGDGIEV